MLCHHLISSKFAKVGLKNNFVFCKRLISSSENKLFFRQLFEKESSTYTYILGDLVTKEAVIIDPVIETVERFSINPLACLKIINNALQRQPAADRLRTEVKVCAEHTLSRRSYYR
jgi:hypothetical protein